jgi:hypothetical protein
MRQARLCEAAVLARFTRSTRRCASRARPLPERRYPVVPPSFIVLIGVRTFVELDDEAVLEHP